MSTLRFSGKVIWWSDGGDLVTFALDYCPKCGEVCTMKVERAALPTKVFQHTCGFSYQCVGLSNELIAFEPLEEPKRLNPEFALYEIFNTVKSNQANPLLKTHLFRQAMLYAIKQLAEAGVEPGPGEEKP